MNTIQSAGAVRKLIAEHSLRRSTRPLTLSSGFESYDYIDAKQIMLVNSHQYVIGEAIAQVLEEFRTPCDSIGGLELGAIFVAQSLLVFDQTRGISRDSFVVRKQPKSHGKGLLVEGPAIENRQVVVVDDVVTTGESMMVAVDSARASGADVVLALTLVDRGEIARRRFESEGIRYHALTTYQDYAIDPVGNAS